MTLGETIRSIRKAKGFSILQIKELTGLSKSTISELENDKSSPTAETLQKIADALRVKVSDFFIDPEPNLIEKSTEEYLKIEQEKYSKRSFADNLEFDSAEAAMQFILKQPAIMGFGGFDINKMSDEDIIDFANELLRQLQLISYKYKK